MNTKTEKPNLEDIGVVATITSNGVKVINEGETPMCAWICAFTNKRGHSENFDYFTGSGCGEKYPEHWVKKRYSNLADVKLIMSGDIKDKALLCRLAHEYNRERKWTPDPIEVIWAIARDGDALEMTFGDWASNLGYDTDSWKAEKIYRACQDNALRLLKILSRESIETIKALEL